MLDFEQVWQDIRHVASSKTPIYTLSQKVPNDVLSCNESSIVVKSRRTKRPRELKKKMFQQFWEMLVEQGQMNGDEFFEHTRRLPWHGCIIMAFLAHLPHVEYSLNPLTLHFVQNETRELGTTRQRR